MAKITKAIRRVSLTTQYPDEIFGPCTEADFQIPVYIFIYNTYQSKLVIKIVLFHNYKYIHNITVMDGSFIQPYSFVHFNIVQRVLNVSSSSKMKVVAIICY
jgi:hypothetical protein